MDCGGDTFAGVTVAIGIVSARHLIIQLAVFEQNRRFPNDTIFVGSDQPDCSRGDGFGPLGLLAQYQDWFAQRWTFFLDAARIGDEQVN